ncbi:MAG: nicotinamide riboside transporter PnuC [Bacteroidales bacterium]|nr:nicotinamide riboside transporter PnuC [Bacteroidales bacterium]
MFASIFFDTLFQNIIQTSWIEFVAVVFGLISVWYCRKENILVYPTGIINVGLYIYIFGVTGLYGNMGINGVYLLMSVYGWWKWARKGEDQEPLRVTRLKTWSVIVHLIVIAILFFVVKELLLRLSESQNPVMDAFTTAVFIVAMWLQARKKLESWILWIVGDLIAIPLTFSSQLVFTSFQYFIFLLLAASGLYEWYKSYLKNKINVL